MTNTHLSILNKVEVAYHMYCVCDLEMLRLIDNLC